MRVSPSLAKRRIGGQFRSFRNDTGTEALEQGQGVCQDHARIFCALCRTLGIPARYVSGYLSHAAGQEAHAWSHAWADAYVEHLGWVSFDPSNRTGVTESYIRTAIGLDYAGAGPIRGVRSGGGVETMTYGHVSKPATTTSSIGGWLDLLHWHYAQ